MTEADKFFDHLSMVQSVVILGGPKRAFKVFSEDPIYEETREKHQRENAILVQELRPFVESLPVVEDILKGKSPAPIGRSGKENTESRLGSLDQQILDLMKDRLVDPDFLDYVHRWREAGLLPDLPQKASPIFHQRLNRRYIALFDSWKDVLFTFLDAKLP